MPDFAAVASDQHSGWRAQMAAQIAQAYAVDSDVAAVYLAGSVARGWADRFSDIELDVFWHRPPRDIQRQAALERAGAVVHVDWSSPPDEATYRQLLVRHSGQLSQIWPYEELEWSEHFYVDGFNIGVSAFLVETMESWLADVVERNDTDDDKHMRVAALQHAVPLHGRELVDGWQARVTYPDSLARAVIDELLGVQDRWWDVDFLVARDAFIPRTDLLVRMERWLLRLLLAVNRIYLPDPRFKWADRLIDQMAIRPDGLAERLRKVFRAKPKDGVAIVQALAGETLDLIDLHLPGCDTGFTRAWLGYRRAVPSPNRTRPLPRTRLNIEEEDE